MFQHSPPRLRALVVLSGLLSTAISSQTQAFESTKFGRSCPPAEVSEPTAARPPAAVAPREPLMSGAVAPPADDSFRTRIVVVEWKIKKGSECAFLNYWSTRSTVPDRAGLISEFLNEVDNRPWVNWSLGQEWTTFYNVGLWRDSADFEDQIGKHIDNSRPPLEFEAAKRTRVFLAPARWRIGNAVLPITDPPGVR